MSTPSPSAPPAVAPEPGPPRKPPGLSAAIGLSIAIAVVEILGGLGALGTLGAKGTIQQMAAKMSGAGVPESTQRMLEYQQRIMDASMTGVSAALYCVEMAVAIWLLVSVVRMSGRRAGAATGMATAALVLGVLEIGELGLKLLVQARIRPLMAEMMQSLATADPKLAGAQGMMGTIMQGSMIAGIAFTVLWMGGKIFTCFYTQAVARRPAVRAWIGEPTS